jgi:hypothetical protein
MIQVQHFDSSALGLVRRLLLIGYFPIHSFTPPPLNSARAEMTALPRVDTKCTTPSRIPTVNGNTVRSLSTHGQQSAAKGSSTTVSRSRWWKAGGAVTIIGADEERRTHTHTPLSLIPTVCCCQTASERGGQERSTHTHTHTHTHTPLILSSLSHSQCVLLSDGIRGGEERSTHLSLSLSLSLSLIRTVCCGQTASEGR